MAGPVILAACAVADDPVERPSPGPDDPVFDDAHVLVTSSLNRLDLFRADGTSAGSWPLDAFVEDDLCAAGECRVEGVTPDGDGLLVAWARQRGGAEGGLLRLDPVGGLPAPTWATGGWAYPHEVARDGDLLVVADAFLDTVVWVIDDGSPTPEESYGAIDAALAMSYAGHLPNGMTLLEHDGTTWALVSYRGTAGTDSGNQEGQIAMWDATDPTSPRLMWHYPEAGVVLGPHDPTLHWRDGRWLLLYAHSQGGDGGDGTIGVAEMAGLGVQPTYLADLWSPDARLGYPRGACLTGDDTLYVTDTPSLSGGEGAIYRTRLPADLVGTGRSGAWDDQERVEVDLVVFATGLDQAYRSFLWEPTFTE